MLLIASFLHVLSRRSFLSPTCSALQSCLPTTKQGSLLHLQENNKQPLQYNHSTLKDPTNRQSAFSITQNLFENI